MDVLNTPLTRLLGVNSPILCPPMTGACGGALAARVSIAGGFGFVAAGYDSVGQTQTELSLTRRLCGTPSQTPLPVGVGFLVWKLEKMEGAGFSLVDAVLQERVRAVWFSFGKTVSKYVEYVRHQTKDLAPASRPLIFVPVSTAEEAVIAVSHWKVDAIVAQGIEAGGHGSATGTPLASLLVSVLDVVPPQFPVIAAGGLANGVDVASVIKAGASGACLGTRFLLTPESSYTEVQKQVLIKATTDAAVRTMAFDHVQGTVGWWPEGVDGRGIINDTVHDYDNGVSEEIIRRSFIEGVKLQNPDRMVVWSGTGVGRMDQILPAEEIVRELHTECADNLRL